MDKWKVELPVIEGQDYSIVDFGAEEGGLVSNTEALRQAVLAAHRAGGGRVVVPAGLWLTGPIELLSHVELRVEKDALLLFDKNDEEYRPIRTNYEGEERIRTISPIHARDAEDIAITGEGVIDGNGHLWRPVKDWKMTARQWAALIRSGSVGRGNEGEVWYPTERARDGHRNRFPVDDPDWEAKARASLEVFRPVMVSLVHCTRVLIENVTLQNSPAWNVHPLFCEHVTIRGAFIRNDWFAANGDGLDLESCRYALIENTRFDVGDDGICLKAGRNAPARKIDFPTEYVTVRHYTVYHAHGGFVVGSEMSRGVRHILVEDCLFIGTDVGIRFKSQIPRGGVVEDILIQNIRMVRIGGEAIIFTMGYQNAGNDDNVDREDLPEFRNVTIRNVICLGAARALKVFGLKQLPIHDIVLQDVVLEADTGYSLERAENIRLQRVSISGPNGQNLYFEDETLDDGASSF